MKTVRKFKCIGLEEKEIGFWNKAFKIGREYQELCPHSSITKLYLKCDKGFPFVVDASQFKLIE